MIRNSDIQAQYYTLTAENYDDYHLNNKNDEHYLALHYLSALIDFYKFKTILDVGAGTGRVADFLKKKHPDLKVISLEPVEELRKIGYAKGLSALELMDGNVYNLNFSPNSIDLVCAFGVFHHLADPIAALNEIRRVSKQAIFISDSNNFAHGKKAIKLFKQFLNHVGLWPLLVYIKTKGKNYSISEGDGLHYSFSIFSILKVLKKDYEILILGTSNSTEKLYHSSRHAAVFFKLKEIII
jgi:ubiquinone/menaquinone biosynthesis C-methylase UbiE